MFIAEKGRINLACYRQRFTPIGPPVATCCLKSGIKMCQTPLIEMVNLVSAWKCVVVQESITSECFVWEFVEFNPESAFSSRTTFIKCTTPEAFYRISSPLSTHSAHGCKVLLTLGRHTFRRIKIKSTSMGEKSGIWWDLYNPQASALASEVAFAQKHYDNMIHPWQCWWTISCASWCCEYPIKLHGKLDFNHQP